MVYDHALCREVHRAFTRALQISYRHRACRRGIAHGHSGAVTCIQRFALIEEALRITSARGWPTLGLFANLSPERSEALRGVFECHGVQVLRFPSKAEQPDLYYNIDAPWNSRGHVVAANTLVNAMRTLGAH